MRFRTESVPKYLKICTKAPTIGRIVSKKFCTRGTDFEKVGQMYPTFVVMFKFCPLVQFSFDYSDPAKFCFYHTRHWMQHLKHIFF